MTSVHEGMKLDDEKFDATVEILASSLDELGVDSDTIHEVVDLVEGLRIKILGDYEN